MQCITTALHSTKSPPHHSSQLISPDFPPALLSRASNSRFIGMPHLNPASSPSRASTLWHGTNTTRRFAATAPATALARVEGNPNAAATARYVVVFPGGIVSRWRHTSRWNFVPKRYFVGIWSRAVWLGQATSFCTQWAVSVGGFLRGRGAARRWKSRRICATSRCHRPSER